MIKNDHIKSIGGVEIDPNFGTVPPRMWPKGRILPREAMQEVPEQVQGPLD